MEEKIYMALVQVQGAFIDVQKKMDIMNEKFDGLQRDMIIGQEQLRKEFKEDMAQMRKEFKEDLAQTKEEILSELGDVLNESFNDFYTKTSSILNNHEERITILERSTPKLQSFSTVHENEEDAKYE